MGAASHRPVSQKLVHGYDTLAAKAELLLAHAAVSGIELDERVRLAIVNTRLLDKQARNADMLGALFMAYTQLSSDKLKPITAESLVETSKNRNRGVQKCRKIAFFLALLVIPFSILSFVASGISADIGKHIDEGNSLILQLRVGLGADFHAPNPTLTSTDTIMKVQQLGTTMRSLYAEANELNYFTLFDKIPESDVVHKAPEPPAPGLSNISNTINKMIEDFQSLRHYGQTGRDLVSVFYGAISTCFLPVLYALLGVCARLLRQFEQQIRARTYVQSEANSAHFVVAAIGGGVVGLFNNFTLGQSASIPPLAIAFLVGYAVDVFFSFLENLLQTFAKRSETEVRSKAAAAGA